MAGTSVFASAGRKDADYLRKVYDADGNEIEIDIREDEEQNVKLTQTVELLLAAGYFRARIKGLSPFDKVVGGMTWCIQTCNFDVDVDLLFQENSTIGQKIALTEKIVGILPKMKCPHRIEPHQIQGLDFIHIYPVVQWLVKKAVATKEEMGDYIRAFSISQFNKTHSTPQDDVFKQRKEKSVDSVKHIKDVYKPQRKYRRHDSHKLTEEETRVQSTLLEYGRRHGFSKSSQNDQNDSLSDKKKTVAEGLGEEEDEAAAQEEEERRIRVLMSGMSAMPGQQSKLTASAVGSLVNRQSEQIQQIAAEYADKQAELDKVDRPERVSGVQQHQRMMTSVQKQINQQRSRMEQIESKHGELHQVYLAMKEEFNKAEEYSAKLAEETDKLEQIEQSENQEILQKLRDLVAQNEKLKKQEQEFRANCKEEMAKLQESIEKLKLEGTEDTEEDKERAELIKKQYEADRQKLHKIRMLLARKTREIGALQRKIDEVPSRAELSQYQKRFVELYNQVGAKYKETKQFYTLYNTQDDTKLYLNKEVNLLNSIHDNFQQAMSSAANKEQFLKQFDQIVEGIKQNRNKVEKKKQGEKMKRDQLNDEYLDLIEKQRLYFKTVRDFQEECHKNEILLAKLKQKGL